MSQEDGSARDTRRDEAREAGSGGGAPRPWIRTVGADEAEGRLAELYASLAGGRPFANILDIQTLHPEGLERHHALYRTLMFGPSPLSRAERESIALVVSAANDCFY